MSSTAQIVIKIITYALALLSVAAGIPKVLQMSQELGFLSSIGLSGIAVSMLGVVQFAGGVMLFWSRLRLAGALLATLALVVSSAAIFNSGNSVFAAISLLPIFLAILVIAIELRGRGRTAD